MTASDDDFGTIDLSTAAFSTGGGSHQLNQADQDLQDREVFAEMAEQKQLPDFLVSRRRVISEKYQRSPL
jgi:hypothetical protein